MNEFSPSITEFIRNDFLIFEENQDIQLLNNYDCVIQRKEDHFFYLTSLQEWKPCLVIQEQVLPDISKLIKLLHKDNMIIIENENRNVVGYISLYSFCTKLLYKYQHLAAYFHTILQTIDTSVTAIDENEIVKVWTKQAEEIFSYSQEEVIGNPITKFFKLEHLQIIDTLRTGRTISKHQHQAREDLIVLINAAPVYLDKKIIGAVVSETDITRHVRLNQELFYMSEKMHDLEKKYRKLAPSNDPFQAIKGNSRGLEKTIDRAKKVCTTKAPVLLLGESGVGKEVFAKAIHEVREGKDAPFIAINCGAIPASLFESELFGYEKGAFSGADLRGKKGKIEMARGGTLFLDEIGEMPLDLQVKLLRVLQEKRFFPIGGTKEVLADFRIIAATNRDLQAMIHESKFREDLYYRLNVVNINIPPLRERREDVIELSHHFFHEFSLRYERPIHSIPQQVMQDLLQHDWPGNVRELRNVVERLVVFSSNGEIKREDLPFHNDTSKQTGIPFHKENPFSNHYQGIPLADQLEQYERNIILETLKQENNNKQATAQTLGVSRATLYNRMKKLNI
ncbi:sigma 54-interacting transcriptional regulator [Margalitia sp. FSL K6-0131]|uniref:sigma-54 interaction domain-containing protein n=1 Tax=Margalitia sp. FSL K6-0131 TaxID=2954604 RepID=UPI0030FBC544